MMNQLQGINAHNTSGNKPLEVAILETLPSQMRMIQRDRSALI